MKLTVNAEQVEIDLLEAIEEIQLLPNEVINEVSEKYAKLLKEKIKSNFESSYKGYQTGATLRTLRSKSEMEFGKVTHSIGFYGNRAYIAYFNEKGTSRMQPKHFMERARNEIEPMYISELKSKLK